MAAYPCDQTTCTIVNEYRIDPITGTRCLFSSVRFATPRVGPTLDLVPKQLSACTTDLSSVITDGGVSTMVFNSDRITWLQFQDQLGNNGHIADVRVWAPAATAFCEPGFNVLSKIDGNLNPFDSTRTSGGLAAVFTNSDDIAIEQIPTTSCGGTYNSYRFKLRLSPCTGNAVNLIKDTNGVGSGFGVFFDPNACITASFTPSLGACGTTQVSLTKLSLRLLNLDRNALQCVDDYASVLVREFGPGIRLAVLPRLDGLPGKEIEAQLLPSGNDNNVLSVSIDCGTSPGPVSIGYAHVGFNKLSKSMNWSRIADACSAGRWAFDAELKLTTQAVNATTGQSTNGAKLTANGYWFNPETAGNVANIEQPIGGLLHDGALQSLKLELDVINPSSVRSAIAVIDFRSAHTLRLIKTGLHYRVRSLGFIGSSLSDPGGSTIGQDTYRIDTRTGYTGGNWRELVGSYSETVVLVLAPGETRYCSLVMILENLIGGGAIASGDIEIGSYEITSAIVTVGVDGARGIGQPLVGALPSSIAALP